MALHPVSIEKAHYFEIAPWLNDRKERVLINASIRVNSLFQTFELLILLSSESFETRKLLALLKELLLVRIIEVSPDILFQQNGLVVEEQISLLELSLRLVKVVYPSGNQHVFFILNLAEAFHQILVASAGLLLGRVFLFGA